MKDKSGRKVSFDSSNPEPTDEDCKAYFKRYEKNGLDSLTQMFEIHREKGESILEAFYNVQTTYLEILLKAVDNFNARNKIIENDIIIKQN